MKIPDVLDVQLRYEASRRGTTLSEVVREAIEEHLARGNRRGRLHRAAGRSGSSDVSERIEELLREEWRDLDSS